MKQETLQQLQLVYPQNEIKDIVEDVRQEFLVKLMKENEIFPGRIVQAIKPTDIVERVYEENKTIVEICLHICGNDKAKIFVNEMWNFEKTQRVHYCHLIYIKKLKVTGYRLDNGIYRYYMTWFPLQPYVYAEDENIEEVGHLKCFLKNGREYVNKEVDRVIIERWCNSKTGKRRAVIGEVIED